MWSVGGKGRQRKRVPLEDDGAVTAADVVGDFSSVAFVVHQKKLKFPHVADQEFLQTVREEMSCLLVATITDLTKVAL